MHKAAHLNAPSQEFWQLGFKETIVCIFCIFLYLAKALHIDLFHTYCNTDITEGMLKVSYKLNFTQSYEQLLVPTVCGIIQSPSWVRVNFSLFLQEYLIESYSSMSEWSGMEGYFCCWPFALIKNSYAH